MAIPTLTMQEWKWFYDPSDDTTAEPSLSYAAESTGFTAKSNYEPIRLRMRISCGSMAFSASLFLQYSTDQSSWSDFGGTYAWAYANGTATYGNQLSSRLLSTGSSTLGLYHETGSTSESIASNGYNEIDFCIIPNAGYFSTFTTYYFRHAATSATIAKASTWPSVTTAGAVYPLTILVANTQVARTQAPPGSFSWSYTSPSNYSTQYSSPVEYTAYWSTSSGADSYHFTCSGLNNCSCYVGYDQDDIVGTSATFEINMYSYDQYSFRMTCHSQNAAGEYTTSTYDVYGAYEAP